jgi:hypothetical protein
MYSIISCPIKTVFLGRGRSPGCRSCGIERVLRRRRRPDNSDCVKPIGKNLQIREQSPPLVARKRHFVSLTFKINIFFCFFYSIFFFSCFFGTVPIDCACLVQHCFLKLCCFGRRKIFLKVFLFFRNH